MAYGTNHEFQSSGDLDLVGDGLNCHYHTRAIGRKRVVPNGIESLDFRSPRYILARKCRTRRPQTDALNRLESLPQDLLIRILTGVNHSDIKQLLFVSRAVREAALIAKKTHFAFSTPLPKPTKPFLRDISDSEDGSDVDAPPAPMQPVTYKSRINSKRLGRIVVALFPDE